jgi:hypothetical protein
VRAAGGEPPGDVDGLDLTSLARGAVRGRDYLEARMGYRPGYHTESHTTDVRH